MLVRDEGPIHVVGVGEKVDAVLNVAGRLVDLEITRYRAGTVSTNAELGAYQVLHECIRATARQCDDLRGLCCVVTIEFRRLRNRCNDFAREIVEAIRRLAPRIRELGSLEIWIADEHLGSIDDDGRLLRSEFPVLGAALQACSCWNGDHAGGLIVSFPGETPGIEHVPGTVARIVKEKVRKHLLQAHSNPTWLVIFTAGRPETARVEADVIAGLIKEASRGFAELAANPFERGYWLDQTHGEPVLVRFG